MKKILTAALVIAIVFALGACKKRIEDSGIIREQDVSFTDVFSNIENKGKFNVKIVPAVTQKIHIKADAAVYRILKQEVVNGRLLLHYIDNNKSYSHSNVEITVYATGLKEISLSGSGTISSADTLNGGPLVKTTLSGSGNMDLLLEYPAIFAVISGSGTMKLGGKVDEAFHNVSGSGNIMAYDLQSKDAEAIISGSGNIRVLALQTLDATISGSGNIYYKGNPLLSKHISGSGKVLQQ